MMTKDELKSSCTVDSKGCWIWNLGKTSKGYGVIYIDGQSIYEHRLSAHLFFGLELYSPKYVCHKCDNSSCCNPAHLFIGDHDSNMNHMVVKGNHVSGFGLYEARKTHCPQGHPYDSINTYYYPNGYRKCRTCMRELDRKRSYEKNKRWRAKMKALKQQQANLTN